MDVGVRAVTETTGTGSSAKMQGWWRGHLSAVAAAAFATAVAIA